MKAFGNNQGSDDFRRRMTLYLDGALTKQEEREFLGGIRKSPECLAQLQKEQSFREFLKKKVSRKNVSPALVKSIKSKLNISSSS